MTWEYYATQMFGMLACFAAVGVIYACLFPRLPDD